MGQPAPTVPARPIPDVPFVNEVRLNARNWAIALLCIAAILFLTPRVWKKLERFETGPDYRIPYPLSRDYWLYQRRLDRVPQDKIVLLGDSVIWGEYVLPDGTLSHFLNTQSSSNTQNQPPERFVNGGVNGLFPLALEGLVNYYADNLAHRRVILHCNLLWMSSPKADLQVQKEEKFNHSRLVPQFSPRIPCYKANANERLSVVIERNLQFMSWVTHLQNAYFEDRSVPLWTLEEDSSTDPPRYPNSYKNPFTQITMQVPTAPANDPMRGPTSARHKSWNKSGANRSQFEWVELETSLQWAAFKRILETLKSRHSDVLVVLGPFNEHLIADESLAGYRKLREGIVRYFTDQHVDFIAPGPLPSELYADASHPLTEGYRLLAAKLLEDPRFSKTFLERP
jgi:hypothetical protein